jgi:hypothetical protein
VSIAARAGGPSLIGPPQTEGETMEVLVGYVQPVCIGIMTALFMIYAWSIMDDGY